MTINAKIKKMSIPVVIKGKLASPEIKIDKIDKKGLMKEKAKEEIEKRLPEDVKKSPAGDLLKKFF